MFIKNKILILGFARSGYEAAKVLIKRNNTVIINDKKNIESIDKNHYLELKNMGVQFILGSHPSDLLDDSFDCLIKNPGVSIEHEYVLKAHELNIPVINEIEMTYQLLPKDKNIKIIGISGTNGKTTTTTLIYEILKKSSFPVYLVGNIGYPLCSILDKIKQNDILVVEISAQQLEDIKEFKPDISVLTNISEAHLEFFKTYEKYINAKNKLLINQDKNDLAILNKNDSHLINFSKNIKSSLEWYSINDTSCDCYFENNSIFYKNEQIIHTDEILLKGNHNYENIMASILVAKEFNISNNIIKEVLTTFTGVEHRLEFVREVNGRKFYNDTEATNIKCTKIALSSFFEPIILILGGYERGQDFNELDSYMQNVKSIIGIGQCRERVLEFGNKNNIPTYIYETLKDGFSKSYEISDTNDTILLSPASASWDQYKQCEDRGDEFKKYVNEIK